MAKDSDRCRYVGAGCDRSRAFPHSIRRRAEPCRAGVLCRYSSPGFISMQFVTERRGRRWDLADYGFANRVHSYVDKMSVYARFRGSDGSNVWDSRNGAGSSDSSACSGETIVCAD